MRDSIIGGDDPRPHDQLARIGGTAKQSIRRTGTAAAHSPFAAVAKRTPDGPVRSPSRRAARSVSSVSVCGARRGRCPRRWRCSPSAPEDVAASGAPRLPGDRRRGSRRCRGTAGGWWLLFGFLNRFRALRVGGFPVKFRAPRLRGPTGSRWQTVLPTVGPSSEGRAPGLGPGGRIGGGTLYFLRLDIKYSNWCKNDVIISTSVFLKHDGMTHPICTALHVTEQSASQRGSSLLSTLS